MHQIPAASRHLRMVHPDSVCVAAGALADRERVGHWAELLTVLGDPHRLSILLCLYRAEELCVSDLAVAVGMSDSGVSHALRLLRAHSLVTVRRSGRLALYRLAGGVGGDLVRLVADSLPAPVDGHDHGHGQGHDHGQGHGHGQGHAAGSGPEHRPGPTDPGDGHGSGPEPERDGHRREDHLVRNLQAARHA